MKIGVGIICGILLLSITGGALFGQPNGFEMPMFGQRLPVTKFELVNRIPSSHLTGLPKTLPVYRRSSKPSNFSSTALQVLLDQSAFKGTNAADLLRGHTNTALLDESIRLSTSRGVDLFVVAPAVGAITVQNQNRSANPAPDAIPSFETIRDRLIRYAEMLGVNTNDMARNEDGTIRTPRTEDKITRMGGAVKFIGRRSVRFSRIIAGHPMIANDDKIELAIGPDGRIQKFELKWPVLEPVRTNRLFTTQQLIEEIKNGNFLADISNEYPSEAVAKIILKDIRIYYYAFSPRGFGPVAEGTDIFPVASLHVAFESKSGKVQEGGLFVPILTPQ